VIAVVNPAIPVSKLKKVSDAKIQDDLAKFDERLVSSKGGILAIPFTGVKRI
jgi:hypothetical protein